MPNENPLLFEGRELWLRLTMNRRASEKLCSAGARASSRAASIASETRLLVEDLAYQRSQLSDLTRTSAADVAARNLTRR